jgi:site-specific recombinase XerD
MKTTPLRQQLINELDLRGYAPSSKKNYVIMVRQLADHYHRRPDRISDKEIKTYLLHLIRDKQRSRSTLNVVVSALRFFYQHVLGRSIDEVADSLPRMKASIKRPQVYSHGEIERLLSADGLNYKHRVMLMTAYGSGLRVSELCRLKPADILSERMQIRVVEGKGHKDRYTVLSPKLLEELRCYWRMYRPTGEWLFAGGGRPQSPLNPCTAERVFKRAQRLSGVADRGGIHLLRHSFATHLLEAGVPLPVLQRLIGHRSLSSTAVYLHVSREQTASVRSPLDLVEVSRVRSVS